MAVKKSQLYSSLWQSCDELRGGMDASQYKDYVLVMLFVKYVSDKYAGQPFAPIDVPKGASFLDMVALKGDPNIGDKINKLVLGPLFKANNLSTPPDFNDATKLGQGKEMVQRLTNLIAIFENPDLDFSKNRADGDDLLGDAYEYLMRHFATESGKSKGQFYTPAEVSRVMASILGIQDASTTRSTTVYDPTCGSGSLLLKVGAAARTTVSLYGQEKDSATAGLARMNMILHNQPTAEIRQGNTLASPHYLDGSTLKTFDFVVANPPFSDKRWSTGLDPTHDPHERFRHYGVPPAKQGDYAYLLHIVRSLKSTGTGACILPHGVLFRGNAEAEIRRNLVRRGLIKGIIGLPANLFYGTGIPACIVVVDKAGAATRKAIFMVDASKGFLKDGAKNRLREMDLHRIVDVFNRQSEADPRYARLVPLDEIERNDFNLNIPRYIDSQEPEDIQDIDGHLRGGIPTRDVDALDRYWRVCPGLRAALFTERRPGYVDLAVDKAKLKAAIREHAEFVAFTAGMEARFDDWRASAAARLKGLEKGFHPKELIAELGESLLAQYAGQPLIDHYAVYQHLMDYWAETMQDDAYLLAADGWKAETTRIRDAKGKDKGWICELVPKELVVTRYFAAEAASIEALQAKLDAAAAARSELEEEHGGEDGLFAELEKVNKGEVAARLKEIKGDRDAAEEQAALEAWSRAADAEAAAKKQIKAAEQALDTKAYGRYAKLSANNVKALVVDDKWLATLGARIHGELDRITQALTQRANDLVERYETTLSEARGRVSSLEAKVDAHLLRMASGFNGSSTSGTPTFGPSGWETVTLGEHVSFLRRGIHSRAELGNDGPVLNLHYGDIHTSNKSHLDGQTFARFATLTHEQASGLDPLKNGDLVLADASEDLDGVGKAVEIRNLGDRTAVAGMHTIAARFDKSVFVDGFKGYVPYMLEFRQQIRRMAAGTKVYGITRTHVAAVTLRTPPVEQQEVIAEALSDAHDLIESLERLGAKQELIRQGMMQQLLTGRIRLT